MARFFDSGLTKNELMKRAFRIKPIVPNLSASLALPADLRKQFTKMYFARPTDLELGTLDDDLISKDPADMLTPVRTVTIDLHARQGSLFLPFISEMLAAVPPDLLYTATAFSVKEVKSHGGPNQRAEVTFYTGELPQKIKDQYIIYDGQAYSPYRQLTEALERIEIMKPLKIKGPGR